MGYVSESWVGCKKACLAQPALPKPLNFSQGLGSVPFLALGLGLSSALLLQAFPPRPCVDSVNTEGPILDLSEAIPTGSLVVPVCGWCLGSYKSNPKKGN